MTPDDREALKDVLVLSVKKSYWASDECRVFPHRLYTWQFYGYSQNKFNSLNIFLRGLIYWFFRRPKIIFFGSAHRIIPWFVRLKKYGWLKHTKLIATHQVYFPDESLPYIERVILTSKTDINNRDPQWRHKYVLFPYHADGDYSRYDTTPADYIFSGGGASRDFPSLIEAMHGLETKLRIVTFSPQHLGYEKDLPPNVEVLWRMSLDEFLGHIAKSLFVVVPLLPRPDAHGISTIVQAMTLGKVIISNYDTTSIDYLEHGKTGLLVKTCDVAGYRQAIQTLLENPDLRREMEAHVRVEAQKFSYTAYTENIVSLCRDVLRV